MKISIITLFPEMFAGPFDYSILKRARERKILSIEYIQLRDFGIGKHRLVDDTPYGGGVGMILRADVLEKAIIKAKCNNKKCKEKTILLDAAGSVFNQKIAYALSYYDHLILICGRYEGVDERVRTFIDEEISIGDYVLTGGEIPAMVIVDTVSRFVSGVLGKDASSIEESHASGLLEYPQYTKPPIFKNLKIPKILLSGNHKEILLWRRQQGYKRTAERRPDLLSAKK